MDSRFQNPKTFGQILDHTFSISRAHFKNLFLLLLIFIGPIVLLSGFMMLLQGDPLFQRNIETKEWFVEFFYELEQGMVLLVPDTFWVMSVLLNILLTPMAIASILLVVNHIRKGESYEIGNVIKQAFKRYGPMLGSSILFGLLMAAIYFAFAFVLFGLAFSLFATDNVGGGLLVLLLIPVFIVVILLLVTRFSFYIGSVVFKEGTPGFSRSWKLTRKRTWATLGMYLILTVIIFLINAGLQLTVGLILGNGVIGYIVINLLLLIGTIILTVGYAVMYFDLKLRNDPGDFQDMIDSYES
ncbi:MAG TPA: hypothetical protein VIG73_09100 [Cerasibacillus sp.]|uniref:DUF7847 domain-containing protein n=1 Tax=Cerasibacillus sp. TaxID=2498711 RepID=UPI002F3FEA3A